MNEETTVGAMKQGASETWIVNIAQHHVPERY
jgi:hypothetical protein